MTPGAMLFSANCFSVQSVILMSSSGNSCPVIVLKVWWTISFMSPSSDMIGVSGLFSARNASVTRKLGVSGIAYSAFPPYELEE